MKTEVIAIVNQKGGVRKNTTCINLGIGMFFPDDWTQTEMMEAAV